MTEQPQIAEEQIPANEAPKNPLHKLNLLHVMIGVIAGVILLGMGFGVYLLTQSKSESTNEPIKVSTPSAKKAIPSATATPSADKDETDDWIVYKDDDITLKYPKGWKRYDSLSKPSFSEKDPNSVSPGVVVPTVAISNSPVLSVYETDIKGLLNSKIGDSWDSGAKHYEKLKNLLIDNYEAVWIRQTLNPNIAASGLAIDHVYIRKDTKVYEVSIWTNDENELDKYSDIFDQILLTFKFLD